MSEETRPRYRPLPDPLAGTTTNESGLTVTHPTTPPETQAVGYSIGQDNSSPGFQRDAIRAQLERLRESRRDEIALREEMKGSTYGEIIKRGMPDPGRLLAVDAHFLLVAIGGVLRTSKKLLSQVHDPRLADARQEFDATYPHAADLRDIHEHLEAYAVGEGWLQRETMPEDRRVRTDGSAFWLQVAERFDPDCAIWINFSDSRRVELKAAAEKAVGLTLLMEEIEDQFSERHGAVRDDGRFRLGQPCRSNSASKKESTTSAPPLSKSSAPPNR